MSVNDKIQNIEIGDFFSPLCRVEFCDNKCKKNISEYTFRYQIDHMIDEYHVKIKNCDKINDFFSNGTASFIFNNTIKHVTKIINYSDSIITLFVKANFLIDAQYTLLVTINCDKRQETCYAKFNNIINFRGEVF